VSLFNEYKKFFENLLLKYLKIRNIARGEFLIKVPKRDLANMPC
jgi:hypothetical protein